MTKRRLQLILLFILAAYAGLALAHVVRKTLDPAEGYDFFSYWQPLQFVRQGINPYLPAVPDYPAELRYPLVHLDGVTPDAGWYDVLGAPYPANTPVMLFLLLPYSLFTWPTAKALWFVTNLLLLAGAIGLAVRIVTGGWRYLRTPAGVAYALAVLGMLAVRNVLGLGQTTLLIVACMLLGLYWQGRRRPWLAGLALGLALAKYTLGMALFVYFVYKRQWLSLLVALLVQAGGFVLLAALTGTSVSATVLAYARLAAALAGVEGIHLGAWLPWPPLVAALAVTLLFAAVLLLAYRARGSFQEGGAFPSRKDWVAVGERRDLLVLALAGNWALLAVYHRYYDLALLLFGLLILWHMAGDGGAWGLTAPAPRWLGWLAVACALLLLLPGTALQPFLPAALADPYLRGVMAAGTLAPLLVTAGLLYALAYTQNIPDPDNHSCTDRLY